MLEMDFKSLVNRESFKAILHHHLKNQAKAKFGNSIFNTIQSHSENDTFLSYSIVESIGNDISESTEYKEFLKTFLNSLNNLFEDKDKYIPKDDMQGTISQCSSASSVNTSIDYISYEQFQDIINALSNGINAEKLEALETFSRLPTLEHITKQTLWPSIENGLQNALLSNVSFLKEASLKVYTKMLSSSEPKVVQESFDSLIKHLLHNLLQPMNQNFTDFISKCKSAAEIIAILSRFLQNIPNHWLRYPQPVIEDIVIQSINILSFGSIKDNAFPVWLCIALCDKKSKWFKNLLYGYISRSFILDTLQKDVFIIKHVVEFCKSFNLNEECGSWTKECCQKLAEVSEITHFICFLSYLLQYSQGRDILCAIYSEEKFISWLNALDLIMKCSNKICSVACLNCCSVVIEVVSKLWYYLWSSGNDVILSDSLAKVMLYFKDIQNFSTNSVIFIIECLNYSFYGIISVPCSEETEDTVLDFVCILLKYLTDFSFDFPNVSSETLRLFNSSLLFLNKVLLYPSNLFINPVFIKILSLWCTKMYGISKTLASTYGPGMKSNVIKEAEKNLSQVFVCLLQKATCITISQNIGLFEISINVLLEHMLNDIKSKNSICPHDLSVLSNALSCCYVSKSFMNKSMAIKLAAVTWQLDTGDMENLAKVKCVLETLIPSIFPHVLESDILLEENCDNDETFFQNIILFPFITKQEFVMFEEYNLLSLQVISILTCSILSSCYLQAKYKLSNVLFELQSHHYDENGKPIIDPLSIVQNHLLVKLYVIGGSREKMLPCETLCNNKDDYDYPFFKKYPVPDVYYKEILSPSDTELDLGLELNRENIKEIFLEYIERDLLTINGITQILKVAVGNLEPVPAISKSLNFVCLEDISNIVLQDEIMYGVDMTKRYSKILGLVSSEENNALERLLKAGKCLLSAENRSQFDIFVATVSLIFHCDIQTAWLFLEAFAKSTSSLFIWYERILQAVEQNEKFITFFNILMEHCDVIVKKTLPHIYSALHFSGILPSVLFKYWTIHCYWNYLDFIEIAQFVTVTAVFGGDFAIYFFVSVLKHMKNVLLKNAHDSELLLIIKQNPIKDYKVQNYMNFMIELAEKFHNKISKSVTDFLDE